MATQVQLRGGTTSEHSSFTGAAREVTVDTDKDVVVVHDGSTAGGIPLAKEASVLPLAGGTMTGAITTTSTFDGRDVATDGSKLDAIEASADVTDTTNVTASGALMDSEVTNLTQVKAFDSTDYATAAQGATANAALPKAGGTMTGDVSLGDGVKATFGAGNDLQIRHTGTTSYIQDSGDGDLIIKSNGTHVKIIGDNDEDIARFTWNGSAQLYYNGSPKLATTTTGIDVTGSVTCDGFTSTGIDDNATSTAITIDASENLIWYQTPTSSAAGISFTNTTHPTINISGGSDTGSRHRMTFTNGNGLVGNITTSGSSTAYNTSSDYRLKEDDQPMVGSIDRLKALRPINFAWKADGSRVDGFLAHEAQEVVPECATGTKDAMRDEEYEVTPAVMDGETVVTEAVMGTRSVPDYQGIDQSKLVPLLVASLQEAVAKIEALEARVTALEV